MDLYVKTTKMKKICDQTSEMQKQFGPIQARYLARRLSEIQASETLSVLSTLPQARCHELKGKRKGQFAVDLKHPYRLIFEPKHHSIPLKEDGGFDMKQITAITVLEVSNYHD